MDSYFYRETVDTSKIDTLTGVSSLSSPSILPAPATTSVIDGAMPTTAIVEANENGPQTTENGIDHSVDSNGGSIVGQQLSESERYNNIICSGEGGRIPDTEKGTAAGLREPTGVVCVASGAVEGRIGGAEGAVSGLSTGPQQRPGQRALLLLRKKCEVTGQERGGGVTIGK